VLLQPPDLERDDDMVSQIERRGSDRAKVMLSAMIEQGPTSITSRIVNLSSEGALVLGAELAQGATVRLRRNGLEVSCRVKWRKKGECGLEFERPIDPQTVLRTISKPRRSQVIQARPAKRSTRPGLRCVPMTEAERASFATWATEGKRLLGD
jgi:PilZ domain